MIQVYRKFTEQLKACLVQFPKCFSFHNKFIEKGKQLSVEKCRHRFINWFGMVDKYVGCVEQVYSAGQLASMIKQSDKRAFDYIYRHFSGCFYGYLCHVLKDDQIAQNCLTEVFVTIWKRLPEAGKLPISLYCWMQAIVVQTSLKYA